MGLVIQPTSDGSRLYRQKGGSCPRPQFAFNMWVVALRLGWEAGGATGCL